MTLCPLEAKVISWDGVHFTDFSSGLAAKLARRDEWRVLQAQGEAGKLDTLRLQEIVRFLMQINAS